MNAARTLIRAAMVVDGESVCAAPGVVLLEGTRIVAAGSPEAVGTPAAAQVDDRSDSALLPALVNAHCHLDLSHLGPVPCTGEFVTWIDMIRGSRATAQEAIAASVRAGIAASLAGGSALVGDIAGAGSVVPLEELRRSALGGVSFIEFFGLGARQSAAIEAMGAVLASLDHDRRGVRVGLQPHAPYSCGPEVYRAAARLGAPIATHLAETPEELLFAREAAGPLADFLRRLGAWDDSVAAPGRHPVDAVAEWLECAAPLLAHLNYIEDRHLETLARWGASVVYCPRASAYFAHPRPGFPGHRYREMLDAGVNVALGTDGLPCLDTPDRISVLDEMRLLHRRDGVDPRVLLRMATVNGAAALGIDRAAPTLLPGGPGRTGVIAVRVDPRSPVDPLRQVLAGDAAPAWIAGPGAAGPGADGPGPAAPGPAAPGPPAPGLAEGGRGA